MIVPMRMVTVVCRQPETASALVELRELGVVHLLPHRLRPSSELDQAQKQRDWFAMALVHLPAGAAPSASSKDAAAVATEAQALAAERRDLEQQAAELRDERKVVEPFGDFDPDAARSLAAQGLALDLYLLTGKGELPAAPSGSVLQRVGAAGKTTAAVMIGPPGATLTGAAVTVRKVPLPVRSLGAIDAALATNAARTAAIDARLQQLAGSRAAVASRTAELDQEIELLAARAGMSEEPDLAWLSGACPEGAVRIVEAAAARHGWALHVREPGPDDPVPTLLDSGRFSKQVHSVLEMLGITPGYTEPDSSALFLVFLVLFAAMLIGDAGYGSLLLLATFVLGRGARSRRAAPSQPLRLLRTIAVATIGWGAITGTWFAIPSLPPFLDALRVDWLTDPATASRHVMLLCFFVGAVHLTVAHGWAALRSWRTLAALAQLGWIACTWFMFAIARHMVLGDDMPPSMWSVLAAGVALIVVFMTPPGKLKDEWFNHVMLPLSLVSNFVDVVSYLRLFAVGTAGVAVASSFNTMAASAAEGGGFGWVAAAVIVVFGHSLNLALCAMGVLVHGVRLNTLEFSAHLGLQWNGVSYRPFARRLAAPTATPEPSRTDIPEA